MPIAAMRQNRLCAFAICTLLGFLFWGCGTSKKALPMKDRKGEAERLMQFEQFKQTTLPHTAFLSVVQSPIATLHRYESSRVE